MRWTEAEAALERIWDLHDQLSDAILAVSRTHFLPRRDHGCCGGGHGYVFLKVQAGEHGSAAAEAVAAMADARSLHAIRTALEDLEEQLEFLHTVQSQQRAERDAAIARLEQSRIALAMRLAEHQGKKYRVIEEALAFVGDVSDESRFVSPEDVCGMHGQSVENAEDSKGNSSNIMAHMLSCSLSLARNSLTLERIGGTLGNAAMFAVSMLTFLQLHRVAFGSKTSAVDEYRKRIDNRFQSGSLRKNGKEKNLEVFLARG